jgi:hypothetical protein
MERVVRQYARLASASTALIAVVALVMALLTYLTQKPISVVASSSVPPRVELAVLVGVVALAISLGYFVFPRASAIVALSGTAALALLFIAHPIHAGAWKGLGLLLTGPVWAALGILRLGRHRNSPPAPPSDGASGSETES